MPKLTPQRFWNVLWGAWAALFSVLPFALATMHVQLPTDDPMVPENAMAWMFFGLMLVSVWGPIILGLMITVRQYEIARPWIAPLVAVGAILLADVVFVGWHGLKESVWLVASPAFQSANGAEVIFSILATVLILALSVIVTITVPPMALFILSQSNEVSPSLMPVDTLLIVAVLVTMFPVFYAWITSQLEGARLRRIMMGLTFGLYIAYWVLVTIGFIFAMTIAQLPEGF